MAENVKDRNMTDLTQLPHIGRGRERRLKNAGVDTIEKIAQMSVDDLKSLLDRNIEDWQIEEIIKRAREMVSPPEAGVESSTPLEASVESSPSEKSVESTSNKVPSNKVSTGAQPEVPKERKSPKRFVGAMDKGFVNGYVNGNINGKYQVTVSRDGLTYAYAEERKRRHTVLMSILMTLVVLSAVIGALSALNATRIVIDGHFSDWNDVKNHAYSIFDMKSLSSDGYTYLYFKISGIFKNYSTILIFLNDGTGTYSVTGDFKASHLVRVDGFNGMIKSTFFLRLVNLTTAIRSESVRLGFSDDRIELGLKGEFSSYVVYYLDFQGKKMYSTPVVYVNSGYAFVTVKTTNARVVKSGDIFASLDVQLSGVNRISLNLSFSPAENIAGFHLRSPGMDKEFHSPEATVYITSTGVYTLSVNLSSDATPGDVIKIYAKSNDERVTINNDCDAKYLISVPSQVRIDGAFGDWPVILGDSRDDMMDESADIAGYSYTTGSSGSYYFVEFYGKPMLGIPVRITPMDTDRDTIPDYIDPYPNDFNNDGLPDASSDHDIDGDGVEDYPYGPDDWLNTTIPSEDPFPREYWGKPVDIYIGPVNASGESIKLEGMDKLEIYVDTDGNERTGMVYGSIGADYLITLKGIDGNMVERSLSRWDGGWVRISNVSIAKGDNKMEIFTSVPLNNNSRIVIRSVGWTNEEDRVMGVLSRQPSQPHVIYGYVYDEYGKPLPNAPIEITNGRTHDTVTVYTDSNGYYQYDLANLPNGYQSGDKIYVNATNTSSGNKGSASTIVDTSVPYQRVDVNIDEFGTASVAIVGLIGLLALEHRKRRNSSP